MIKNNYTKRLVDVIEYSREEASRLKNSYIGTEHLMLGVIREGEGKACRILRSMNIDMSELKRIIENEVRNVMDAAVNTSLHDIVISKSAEQVLHLSMLESRQLRNVQTGTEHLLLSILRERINIITEFLEGKGINYQMIYDKIAEENITNELSKGGLKQSEEYYEDISDGYTDNDDDDDDDSFNPSSRKGTSGSSAGVGGATQTAKAN